MPDSAFIASLQAQKVRDLVFRVLRTVSEKDAAEMWKETQALLPSGLVEAGRGQLGAAWSLAARMPETWTMDGARFYRAAVEEATKYASSSEGLSDEEQMAVFHYYVSSLAWLVQNDPAVRRVSGIRRPVPWPSLVVAAILLALLLRNVAIGVPWIESVAIAVTNFGYATAAGGLLAGSFAVMGLRTRTRTLIAAAFLVVIGVALANA